MTYKTISAPHKQNTISKFTQDDIGKLYVLGRHVIWPHGCSDPENYWPAVADHIVIQADSDDNACKYLTRTALTAWSNPVPNAIKTHLRREALVMLLSYIYYRPTSMTMLKLFHDGKIYYAKSESIRRFMYEPEL